MLQNLNQYIPDLNYASTKFTFKTVFFQSNYSYCICKCSFELEYLEFISKDGNFNKEKYEKLVECIVKGKCPHVDQVPIEYVKVAYISALQIAVAIGTTDAIIKYRRYIKPSHHSLYYLHPIVLASLKNNAVAASIPKVKFNLLQHVVYGKTSVDDTVYLEPAKLLVLLEPAKLLVLLGRQRDIKFYWKFLQKHGLHCLIDVVEALQITLRDNLSSIQGILIQNIEQFIESDLHYLGKICQLAIIWNNPMIINQILGGLDQRLGILEFFQQNDLANMLNTTCYAFRRYECKTVFRNWGLPLTEEPHKSPSHWMEWLFALALQYPVNLKQIIGMGLSSIPNLSQILQDSANKDSENYSVFLSYNKYVQDIVIRDHSHSEDVVNVLKMLLDFGLDINAKTETSPFVEFLLKPQKLLNRLEYFLRYRQTAELYIFGNSDISDHRPFYATLPLDRNLYVNNNWNLFQTLTGTGIPLVMDGKEHAVVGYDDDECFPFNFMAPLLLECGYSVGDNEAALEAINAFEDSLPPEEVDYINFYLDTPKSLQCCCRNSLRRHFKGASIHRFLAVSEFPKVLKDYILLKPLLKCLPKYLLHEA